MLLLSATAFSQDILNQPIPDNSMGVRNPDAHKGLEQYDFLIGEWDVDVALFRNGQEALIYKAKWYNHWVANGYVVMQEWRGPYSTGIEMRSYDASNDTWHGRNIYLPSPGTWYENTAQVVDSEMIVTTRRAGNNGQESITREIYFDISDSSFSIRTAVSIDGGASWTAGRYSAISHRTKPSK